MSSIVMMPTLVEKPFDGKEWLFETKWDGYRALANKSKRVKLQSRGEISFNSRFPEIVQELEGMRGNFVVDGEIVILDKQGRSHFQLLQNYQKRKEGTPYYYLFDILSLNGKNLTHLPLTERKTILADLIRRNKCTHIRYSKHIFEKGIAFFKKAIRKGLEGIVAKKTESHYQFRRSREWLKIKTAMRQEVVIGGFTEPRGSRKRFGALLIGVYEKGKLFYAGHVGGGFDAKLLDEVYRELKKVISHSCPFSTEPHPNTPVTWVKPKLVCEVSFSEWTQDGQLRQPIFKGLRIDKSAKLVVREKARRMAK